MEIIDRIVKIYNSIQYEGGQKKQGSVYHYTNAAKVIQESNVIRMTNICDFGDRNEWILSLNRVIELRNAINFSLGWDIKYLTEEIEKKKIEIANDPIKRYVFSTSLNNKSDYLLGNYVSKSGGVLEFDINDLVESLRIVIKDSLGNTIQINKNYCIPITHGMVIYDKSKQIDIVKNIMVKFNGCYMQANDEQTKRMCIRYALDKVMDYGIYFKEHYENEEEYRFTYITLIDNGEVGTSTSKGIPKKEHINLISNQRYQEFSFSSKALKQVRFRDCP